MNSTPTFDMIARSFRDALGGGIFDWAIFLVILVPPLMILIWLLMDRGSLPQTRFPKKDLDFFDMVRQQKGLEEFDRDLLIDLADVAEIRPLYRILLEPEAFTQALERLSEQSSTGREKPRLTRHLTYLQILRQRLFAGQPS